MDCVFCSIIAGKIPCEKVYENSNVIAFLDIKPINKGHTLVVTKKHYEDLFSTPEKELAEITATAKKIGDALMKAVKADGINLGMNVKPAAGQLVMHTHLHIIPRFANDGLKHWPGKEYGKGEAGEIKNSLVNELKKKD